MLGPALAEPVEVAKRLRELDRDVPVLILAPPDRSEHVARAVRFAPLLGDEVLCRSTADGDRIVRALEDSIARSRERIRARGAEPLQPPGQEYLVPLLEHAPIGVLTVGRDGTVLAANPRGAELLGLGTAEPAGRALAELFPDSERDRLESILGASDATTALLERERAGRAQFVETTVAPLGVSARVLVLLHDVTAAITAERELRFQTSLLEAQSEAAIDGILVVSADGRMLFFNQRFVEMWGIPQEVVESRSDEAALRAVDEQLVDPEAFRARVDYLYEHPDAESLDVLRLSDGRTFDRYSAPVRGPDGASYGRVWFFRDVTERLRGEDELRRRLEQLEAIYAVADVVDRAETLGEVYERALEGLVRALKAQGASILLLEERELRFVASRGLSEEYMRAVEGYSPWPADARDPQPVVVADAAADEGLATLREAIAGEGIRALAFVPLVHRGRLIGAFMVCYGEPHAFGAEEIQLAQAIASHVAAAAARRRAEQDLRESRDWLGAIFQGVADGITVQDATGRLVFANEAAVRMIGYSSPGELLRAPLGDVMEPFDLIDEERRPLPPERLPGRRALLGETAEEVVGYIARSTGEERWSVVKATPVHDDRGDVQFAINIFHDFTDRRRGEQRVRFLAEAGEALAASLDYRRTLAEVARLAVPAVADWCVVYVQEEGGLRRIAVEHFSGRHQDLLERLGSFEFDLDAQVGVPAVLRTGHPQYHPDATAALLAGDLRDPVRAVEKLGDLEICSWMCVPLTARGRTFGAISFVSGESGRRFGEDDLELARELARRAALAVDNARLYGEAQESLALLDTLLASAPVGIGFWDENLRYVRVNEKLAEMNGLPAEEHLGKTLADVIPDLAPALEPLYRRVLETGEPYVHQESTTQGATLPGERRDWLSSYFPVQADDGRVLGVGAIITDVTEQRRAEDERARLLEAERDAREAAEAAQVRLTFLAEASRILASSLDYEATLANVADLANRTVADWVAITLLDEQGGVQRIVGRHRDSERNTAVDKLLSFPKGVAPGSPLRAVLAEGRPLVLEEVPETVLRAISWDDEQFELFKSLGIKSALAVPVVAAGKPLGAITFVFVQEGRKFRPEDLGLAEELGRRAGLAIENARLYQREQAARREAEARAEAAQALEFVGDGVVVVDSAGIVRLWNPAAEAVTGLPAAAVVGRVADDAIPGWASLAPGVPVGQGRSGARPQTLPLELEGRELWLSISGVGFGAGTVYAFRDVSEERGVEKLKSDFVSTISHELRTPLAAIYGAALTLRRPDVHLGADQQSELLGVIASEAERLARIVNDILWTSRIESGGLQVTIVACDAAELARSVVQAARLQLPLNLELALDIPESLPKVAGDPDKVRQVLTNLLDNAVKYSPEGGRVDVRLLRHEGAVRFCVRDRGLGIPARERERIFEKFYRLDPHLTRGVGGTGLGLYICRELVERMGGRISVESEEGPGSTFVVDLPTVDDVEAH